MPIVHVLIFDEDARGDFEAKRAPAWTRALADRLGECFGTEPGRTWVTLERRAPGQYAENDAPLEPEDLPTLVDVLHADGRTSDHARAEARSIAAAVADVLGRPSERVHVVYAPSGRGRVAFGGVLLE